MYWRAWNEAILYCLTNYDLDPEFRNILRSLII